MTKHLLRGILLANLTEIQVFREEKKGEKQKIYFNKSKHENQYLTTKLCILMAFKV